MDLNQPILSFAKTSHDIWTLGWAEANGGNISLRLSEDEHAATASLKPKSDWIGLAAAVATLGGERFIVTGTGRYLRNIELYPEKNMGVIELNDTGSAYRILWGYEPEGRPTSELSAHLLTHASIKAATNNRAHAVIHTHTPCLIALTYAFADLSTELLSTLLWKMHAECVVVFPRGVEFLPWMMAGSLEIGQRTAQALRRRTLVVWEHHGIVGTGRNLDEAFGRIHVAEKAAQIYLHAAAAGGVRKAFTSGQIQAIAANFGCDMDKALLTDRPVAAAQVGQR